MCSSSPHSRCPSQTSCPPPAACRTLGKEKGSVEGERHKRRETWRERYKRRETWRERGTRGGTHGGIEIQDEGDMEREAQEEGHMEG